MARGPYPKKGASASTWTKWKVRDNPDAVCEVCGESDNTVLQLHHKQSKRNGGKNIEENFAISCANCHVKYHRELGRDELSTTERWEEFREAQQKGNKMQVKAKIILEIDGEERVISTSDARDLRDALNDALGESQPYQRFDCHWPTKPWATLVGGATPPQITCFTVSEEI